MSTSIRHRIASRCAVIAAVSAPLLWLGALLAQVATYAGERDERPAAAAIVLGAAAYGRRPSPVFEERIKHAVHLYRSGRVQRLVFTGGYGRGAESAESEVARRYAIARGVRPEHVSVETRSAVTYDNLREAKRLLGRSDVPVLIVSDPLHMKRAMVMARDLGLDARPAPTPTSRFRSLRKQTRFALRETGLLAGYVIARSLRVEAIVAGDRVASR